MNNKNAEKYIQDCRDDLKNVDNIIQALGPFSNIVPYLSKYSIIMACGTIENSYKTIVADFGDHLQTSQVKNFIAAKIRNSSSNPSLDNICRTLKEFDGAWKASFKTKLDGSPDASRLKSSLQSLVDARNDFAHGGSPTISFGDICNYFNDAVKIVEILDAVVV